MVDPSKKFPEARKGLEGPRGGFGFAGPSEAWLRANNMSTGQYSGFTGKIDNQDSVDQEELKERRKKALERFDNPREPQPVEEHHTVPNIRTPSQRDIDEKMRIAMIMEENLKKNQDELDMLIVNTEEIKEPVARDDEKRRKCLAGIKLEKEKKPSVGIKEAGINLIQILRSRQHDFCILAADGKKVFAHRAILSSRSSFFKSLFSGNTYEAHSGQLSLVDFSADSIESVVEFLYSGVLNTSNIEIMEVVYLADYLKLENLKYMLQMNLKDFVSIDNLIDLWNLAVDLKLSILKAYCEELVENDASIKKIHHEMPTELKALYMKRFKKN